MDWKTILIVGLGILSIVVLYYCYKRYYNKEGFQEEYNIISSELLIGSSVLTQKNSFDGCIIKASEMYNEITRFLTDYRNYSGYANGNTYTYYSNKYKKNLTIVDFSYEIQRDVKYWFPYTGQYGSSSNWLSNFERENTKILDLDIYNNNLSNYINFIKTYSATNKQKFIFNRSLAKPELLYRGIDLTQPPRLYDIKDPLGSGLDVLDTNITKVAEFNSSYQSWYTNFVSYAKPNSNLYPQSDYTGDTQYRIFYSGNINSDKPPNLTYSAINSSRKAGQIVNLIPDKKKGFIDNNGNVINQKLELNVYGTGLQEYHRKDFTECMFLGSVFTNFNDEYNLDTILRVPYNGIINGANCFYSFNMFLAEFTYALESPRVYKYLPNQSNIGYNSKLVDLRSGNTIKMLTFTDLDRDNETFINNVKTTYQSKSFTDITNSNQAYVGTITRSMMAKIPPLARRYITSWIYNRSRKYLSMRLDDITASSGINRNELEKAQYLCLAITNFTGSNLDNFIKIYANHGDFTASAGTFTTHATISNVPSEDAAKAIVASSRIYNTYQYSGRTLSLSKNTTGGQTFNSMRGSLRTTNYFRNANSTRSISGNLVTALVVLLENIAKAVVTFPIDGINRAKIIRNFSDTLVNDTIKTALNTTETSSTNVKSIMEDISSRCYILSDYLDNSFIDEAMILIRELKRNINTETLRSQLTISSITPSGTTDTITITVNSASVAALSTYSTEDYISISGTTKFNGNLYRILSVSTNTIIISSSKKGSAETSGFINIYSLKKYLDKANSDINSFKSVIDTGSFDNSIATEITIARNSITMNTNFINFFNNNIITIINTIKSIYNTIDTIQMINKIIGDIALIRAWESTILYDVNSYVKIGTSVYKCIKLNSGVSPATSATNWFLITDSSIKGEITQTKNNLTTAINNYTTFITNIETIKTNAIPTTDSNYTSLLNIRTGKTVNSPDYIIAQNAIDAFLDNIPQYKNAKSIITIYSSSKTSLESIKTTVENLETSIGEGTIAESIGAPTKLEINALINDFNNLIYNNKLLPDYGDLSNLSISDPTFLNSIAQLYYESSDGLYEMTAIYDVYMIGSNSVDIRFDKKQRLPTGRINNLNIQYLPEIQNYNRLLDMMDDGSWSNYYTSTRTTNEVTGQIVTKEAIDYYDEALSTIKGRLEPIFNPIFPINENINVKDLQIELKNLNTSNELITNILLGKLKREERPYIPETQETVGYNYTDRLLTIQYSIEDKISKIETQISGILQSCARVFITPQALGGGKFNFRIDGMAIGVNAALTYNLAYNGNLEVDMANTQGNIGQYYPTIMYTKNVTPPIVCGDIKFINKAVALFNQTAFLNLSTFTCRITGEDRTTRLETGTAAKRAAEAIIVDKRDSNFYDSNDGPLYVDKILGFQQVNENTCYYRWQETQYDPLTNGPFITEDGEIKQRIARVQYQFMYDNVEYQNPRLIPDNNPGGNPVTKGFQYLPESISIPFGDLYLSLYSWYAAATRDLFGYSNNMRNEYNTLYTPEYSSLVLNYNTQTSNLSTLNVSTTKLFSTNLSIVNDFKEMFKYVTVTNTFDDIEDKQIAGTCDSINIKPPIFTNNYSTITYNYRPGDAYGITKVNNERDIQTRVNAIDRSQFWRDGTGEASHIRYFDSNAYNNEVQRIRQERRTSNTYNKYRTVDINDFFNNILNNDYRHSRSKCDNPTIDPENCFTEDIDGCKYTYAPTTSQLYLRIAANIGVRNDIRNAINNTTRQIETTTTTINNLLKIQTETLIGNNIIRTAGKTIEQLYPQISNINDRITSLLVNLSNTEESIDRVTLEYNNLLATQTSDSNLPIYMANQFIPIIKPLPEESYSLDTQFGQCPSNSCTSPVVMNSLVEQYNLDSRYDDTITSILKGATASPFQCDYLVEVRKKNAIVSDSTRSYNMIEFQPTIPSYSDNKAAIYFPGNNYMQINSSCINLNLNNFTIDWFQYSVFNDENLDAFVFSYGNKFLSVQFKTDPNNKSKINFIVYINGIIRINVELNYNQLNRWTYFAIVRYNNIITCYKDGFAFKSEEFTQAITNSSTVYIGSDGTTRPQFCFKGGIRNFSFNNYDALYMNNIFNNIPTSATKNINTKFIIDENNINIMTRNIENSNVTIDNASSPSITQSYLTNGGLLREIFRGNNQNNAIAFDTNNNIFISDTTNHRILKLLANGTTTTYIGTGRPGRSSSNKLLETSLYSPSGLCYGNSLYIADTGNSRICYVGPNDTLEDFIIGVTDVFHITYYNQYVYYLIISSGSKLIGRKHTIVNDFTPNYINLDSLTRPSGISFDTFGNLYITDSGTNNIYRVLAGSINPTILSLPGISNPLSISSDPSGNLYIANSNDNKVYMAINNGSNPYTLHHIAGNGTPSSSLNEGYAKMIPLMAQRLIYNNNTLYIVDSRRVCIINMGCIPNYASGSVYEFNNSSAISFLKIGSPGEFVYKFNKNLFTIQWFMFMEGSGSQTIFTFERAGVAGIDLGLTFDIGDNITKMNLYINRIVYPYLENISTPIEFNNTEIKELWVHMAIVHNGTTFSIYKNSILIYSLNSTAFSFNTNNLQLTIGNRLSPAITTGFKGQMRSFMIYNKLAKTYRTSFSPLCGTIEPYTTSSFPCEPNLVLHLANGTNTIVDSSLPTISFFRNTISMINSYPYNTFYSNFKIKLNYNDGTSSTDYLHGGTAYGTSYTTNLGVLKSISSFNISSDSDINSVQQWLLRGSSDGGGTWVNLHQQSTPYTSRSSPIYPKANTYSSGFPTVAEYNIGGDIVRMTKSFQVATQIEDCSIVITSNVIGYDANFNEIYSEGVTSSNGFFIQENTPYVKDTSGSDVSGFQFIGNLLTDYNSNIQSLYDPIISDSSGILLRMNNAYQQSRSDTYTAVGKLNTLNFNSQRFNNYDNLKDYMMTKKRFINTIFDGYSDTNSYMSNIIRFGIVDLNTIDIVFTKIDLTGLTLENIEDPNYSYPASRITTSGARYDLSITEGFLDLIATYVSDVMPFSIIQGLNDDFSPNLINSRAVGYKDRLNRRAKIVGAITPSPTVTTISLPTLAANLDQIKRLTGLTGLTNTSVSSNVNTATNIVEYMLDNENGTLPIDKTNYIVQYSSATVVNSVTPATINNTVFKTPLTPITDANINNWISIFKNRFNAIYTSNSDNGYPYSSVIRKVYKQSIVNNILHIACSMEYTVGSEIYYRKTPIIKQFDNEVYYKVVFKTAPSPDNFSVLAFESSSNEGVVFTSYDDTTRLLIEGGTGRTDDYIRNAYKNNLLYTQIQFVPNGLTYNNSYSITQLQFFDTERLSSNVPIRVDSLSISGEIPNNNFKLTYLIDGDNILFPDTNRENMINRTFTKLYNSGQITAIFNQGVNVNGFSFMTGWLENNPETWLVRGTADGITWVNLVRQQTIYNPVEYISFYRTPIFSFLVNSSGNRIEYPIPLENQSRMRTSRRTNTVLYRILRIRNARSSQSNRFQITNISLYNTTNLLVINPQGASASLSYLFNPENLNRDNPTDVITYESNNNVTLDITISTTGVAFDGISFVSGIDATKCMDIWTIEASTDGTNFVSISTQDFVYVNETIDYPHFFCRTPIFYNYGRSMVEQLQPKFYDIQFWPIRYVEFTPISMYGNNSTQFEISHFDFFLNGTNLRPTSSINNNLLTPNITETTTINDFTSIFTGNYSSDSINFQFTTAQNFNGFSFISGPDISKCIQLWTLRVSINGSFWVTAHLTSDDKPYSINNIYPSSYFRLPIVYFFTNISIESKTQYYIISASTITSPTTMPGVSSVVERLFKIRLMFYYSSNTPIIQFIVKIDNVNYIGYISTRQSYNIGANSINWNSFINSGIGNPKTTLYYGNDDLELSTKKAANAYNTILLHKVLNTTVANAQSVFFALLDLPVPSAINPSILGSISGSAITKFHLYRNTNTESGTVSNNGIGIDTSSQVIIKQLIGWTAPPTSQGFTNYKPMNYIKRFLLETNRDLNSELFRLIGSNGKVVDKKLYRLELSSKVIIINLIIEVEVIGYTITTGLYSHLSDANSWKVFGMKDKKWILLDKQDNYDIPVERSYTLPPFYFNSKKNLIKDSMPDIKIIEDYYKKKINPFGKAVFKKYMFDNNKTYYMVFDEYDNNRNLIDTDLIIGFVMGKGVVKKPVMYENSDGSFDAFNLKKEEMMAFWKKKIGLKLETKYLSDY